MQYLVIIEKADGNYSAYIPDVPGCVATGKTPEKTLHTIKEALDMHLKGLADDGLPCPEPVTQANYLVVN